MFIIEGKCVKMYKTMSLDILQSIKIVYQNEKT